MSEDKSNTKKQINELTVHLGESTKTDCLACRLTGSVGLFAISLYVFYNSNKQAKALNRYFQNTLASGISNLLFYFLNLIEQTLCIFCFIRSLSLSFPCLDFANIL